MNTNTLKPNSKSKKEENQNFKLTQNLENKLTKHDKVFNLLLNKKRTLKRDIKGINSASSSTNNKLNTDFNINIKAESINNQPLVTKLKEAVKFDIDLNQKLPFKSEDDLLKYDTLLNDLYILKQRSKDNNSNINDKDTNLFVPNPFNSSLRNNFANSLNFIKNFKEDYVPIKLQKDNEKHFEKVKQQIQAEEEEEMEGQIIRNNNSNKDNNIEISKSHFIKKKQSAVNIKRQSGVSYVVQTESKQKNVEEKYKRLGHLVFQGSTSLNCITNNIVLDFMRKSINFNLNSNSNLILVSIFESVDEEEMKEYLLYPKKRLSICKE